MHGLLDGQLDGHDFRISKTKCTQWTDKWTDKNSQIFATKQPLNDTNTLKFAQKMQSNDPLIHIKSTRFWQLFIHKVLVYSQFSRRDPVVGKQKVREIL